MWDFDLETVAKYLVLPSTMIAVSALVGLVLLCLRQTRRWGGGFCLGAFAGYLIFGAGPVAFLLLSHLEYQVPSAPVSEREGVRTIVVLAAHAESDLAIPVSSRVSSETAYRLLETLSLFQGDLDSRVVVSGGGVTPAIMREVLISVGVPADHIMVDSDSASTFESALHLAPLLGSSPFLLVTSAGHMPRAKGVFLKAGTTPRAVPTHYMSKRNWLAIRYLPSPLHLTYSDLAVSEYAALVWYRLKGRI